MWPEREENHSTPTGSEVKNEIISATPHAFMARGEENYFKLVPILPAKDVTIASNWTPIKCG
jgi:hypothetical protein